MKTSVVIPTLDEAAHVAGAVASARVPGVDVWVADGGSEDATRDRARDAGACILDAPRGRAAQMDAGARACGGDAVLFLHADSRLPEGWHEALCDALRDPEVAGGAFQLRFAGDDWGLRGLEWGVRLRMALFAMPYGDQALFVRRPLLEEIGGVPQAPIMEDLDLVKAVKERGRLVLLPLTVETSARRYRGRLLRHMLRNWVALLGWRLGFDRQRLAGWYAG